MNKRNKWYDRNNFEDNQDYTEKILSKFNLSHYHFAIDKWGNLSLLIENGMRKYKLSLNECDSTMEVYRCDVHLNFRKHTKENMVLKKKFEDDCIYDAIKWVSKDSKIS